MRALLLLCLLASSPASAADLLAAGHRGSVGASTIDWQSHFVFDVPVDRVPLAVPLPPGTEVQEGASGVLDAEGRVVALELPARQFRPTVRLQQPLPEGELQLGAPLARGDGVQRVVLSEADFVPDRALGLDRHVAISRQAGVSPRDRRRADRALGGRVRPSDQPLYLVADTRLTDTGGLRGTLRPSGRRVGVAAAVGTLFALVLLLFAVGWRALGRLEEAEEADAYIRREFAGRR